MPTVGSFTVRTQDADFDVDVFLTEDIELHDPRRCAECGEEIKGLAAKFTFSIDGLGEDEQNTVIIYADAKHANGIGVDIGSLLGNLDDVVETEMKNPVAFIKERLRRKGVKNENIYVF